MTPDPIEPSGLEPVATGDRRETMRYEPDPDQLVRVRSTFSPTAPLPPDLPTAREDEAQRFSAVPPVEDAAVVPEEPSVWDARPPDER
jgi:hypothetical protein